VIKLSRYQEGKREEGIVGAIMEMIDGDD